MVAIAIPVFGSQLEKSRQAVDEANARSVYGEAMATYLSEPTTTSGNITLAGVSYTWKYESDKMTVSTTAKGKSDKYENGISYDGTSFTAGTKKADGSIRGSVYTGSILSPAFAA